MPASDPNHISAKPVLSSHARKVGGGKTFTPINEWEEGVCRNVTTRAANISYKNLVPGQIYPLTGILIEYEL